MFTPGYVLYFAPVTRLDDLEARPIPNHFSTMITGNRWELLDHFIEGEEDTLTLFCSPHRT